MAGKPNPAWPPSPIEFVAWCRGTGEQKVIDEIMAYISADKNAWTWQTDEAYTVYQGLHYESRQSENAGQLRKRISGLFKTLDWNSLKKPPPKRTAIEHRTGKSGESEHERLVRKFCSQIVGVFMRNCGGDLDKLNQWTNHAMKLARNEWLAEWKQAGEQGIDDFVSERMPIEIKNPCPTDDPATFADILKKAVEPKSNLDLLGALCAFLKTSYFQMVLNHENQRP